MLYTSQSKSTAQRHFQLCGKKQKTKNKKQTPINSSGFFTEAAFVLHKIGL